MGGESAIGFGNTEVPGDLPSSQSVECGGGCFCGRLTQVHARESRRRNTGDRRVNRSQRLWDRGDTEVSPSSAFWVVAGMGWGGRFARPLAGPVRA